MPIFWFKISGKCTWQYFSNLFLFCWINKEPKIILIAKSCVFKLLLYLFFFNNVIRVVTQWATSTGFIKQLSFNNTAELTRQLRTRSTFATPAWNCKMSVYFYGDNAFVSNYEYMCSLGAFCGKFPWKVEDKICLDKWFNLIALSILPWRSG